MDVLNNNLFRFLHKFPVFKQIHFLHEKIHYDLPVDKWYWGLPAEILIITLSLWALLK